VLLITGIAVAVGGLGLASTLALVTGVQLLVGFALESSGIAGSAVALDPVRLGWRRAHRRSACTSSSAAARDRRLSRPLSEQFVDLRAPVVAVDERREVAQEPCRVRTVDEPVVVGQAQVGAVTDRDAVRAVLGGDDHRPLLDRRGREDADLGRVQDRRVEERPA
jgi:hypothetical protein